MNFESDISPEVNVGGIKLNTVFLQGIPQQYIREVGRIPIEVISIFESGITSYACFEIVSENHFLGRVMPKLSRPTWDVGRAHILAAPTPQDCIHTDDHTYWQNNEASDFFRESHTSIYVTYG